MAMDKRIMAVIYYVLLGFGISFISGLLVGFGIQGWVNLWVTDLGTLVAVGIAAFVTIYVVEKILKLKKL